MTEFAFNNSLQSIGEFDAHPNESPVNITLTPNVLEVQAGASGNFTATFTLRNDADASRVPVYSGYIIVASSAEEDGGALHIPFLGVATDMSTLPIFNTTSGFPTLTSFAIAPNGTIPANNSVVFSMNGSDIPCINLDLEFPSRILTLQVLPGDSNAQLNNTNTTIQYRSVNIDLTF